MQKKGQNVFILNYFQLFKLKIAVGGTDNFILYDSGGLQLLCGTQGGVDYLVRIMDVCPMYFKMSLRKNPETQELSGYYRLVESYRNAEDRVQILPFRKMKICSTQI